MGWERSGRCKFRMRGKKNSAVPQSGSTPPPPPPPLPAPPVGPSCAPPNLVKKKDQYGVDSYCLESWKVQLEAPLSHPPLNIFDKESGEVTEFAERKVPFENVEENSRTPSHWIKSREQLNPDFELKGVGRDENAFRVMDQNRLRFMQMNDISLENFSTSTPRNLHLWQQRPSHWLPRTKDPWCWW